MSAQIVPQDFYVYVHLRETDGLVFYVGKGHRDRAWSVRRRNKHWHSVAKKHGLKVEILQDGLQEWYAFELEMDLIATYGRENLCNMTDGGEGTSGFTHCEKALSAMRKSHSKPEVKEKKSRANFISWSSPETRYKRLSGMKLASSSLKTKAKLSASSKKSWSNQEIKNNRVLKMVESILKNPKIKSVFCIEAGLTFRTTGMAQEWLRQNGKPKAQGSNVLSACNGKLKSAYGYTWRYA